MSISRVALNHLGSRYIWKTVTQKLPSNWFRPCRELGVGRLLSDCNGRFWGVYESGGIMDQLNEALLWMEADWTIIFPVPIILWLQGYCRISSYTSYTLIISPWVAAKPLLVDDWFASYPIDCGDYHWLTWSTWSKIDRRFHCSWIIIPTAWYSVEFSPNFRGPSKSIDPIHSSTFHQGCNINGGCLVWDDETGEADSLQAILVLVALEARVERQVLTGHGHLMSSKNSLW